MESGIVQRPGVSSIVWLGDLDGQCDDLLRNITGADHLPLIVETARRAEGTARKSAEISWSTRVAVPKCGMPREPIAPAQPGDHAQVIDAAGDRKNPLGRRDQFYPSRTLTPVKARGVAACC